MLAFISQHRMFPIPRISESFIDQVALDLGWQRTTDVYMPTKGRLNADYLAPGYVIELKILEEEALEKTERQRKISELYREHFPESFEVDIAFESAPQSIRRELERLVSGPIQTAVKKASRQIRETVEDTGRAGDEGIIIIVNNGFSYLNAEAFESLVTKRCTNDSSRIAHACCITVEYHQGGFDAFVFCTTRSRPIRSGTPWAHAEALREAVQARFNDAMTIMMTDQMNPKLWSEALTPVTDIVFEADGVKYIRRAPEVPDSRVSSEI
ncbi:hypothetical protein [uncultured Sphaerotilus sp.]|uniref:hypothetical protein n=1 Tax=uncultured Sphaerotilus sp. TaxID=474984 RepID=UPI0030CA55D9